MWKRRLTGTVLLALLACQIVCGDELAPRGIPTSQWIQLLQQRDPRQRAQAAEALGKLGTQANDAVPALAAALNDPEPNVRLQAATALGRVGTAAAVTLPNLTAALRDEDEFARYAARWALARIAADVHANRDALAQPQLDAYVTQLTAAEQTLRATDDSITADQLGITRRALEEHLASVSDAPLTEAPVVEVPLPDAAVVEAEPPAPAELAAPARAADDPASNADDVARHAEAAPSDKLLSELRQPDALRRVRAVLELGRQGEAAVPTLIEALRIERQVNEEFGNTVDITEAILEVLQRIGGPAAPALTETLGDDELGGRVGHTLQQLGPAARSALPALIDVLDDEQRDDFTRTLAVDTIGKIGPAARDAVPSLTRIVGDEDNDEYFRLSAIYALGCIGETAREAAPQLIQIVGDVHEYDSLRRDAAETLPKINAPADQAVPALLAVSEGEGQDATLLSALNALGAYEEAAREAVPVLVSLLDQDDVFVGAAAARALAEIGGTPDDAVAPLIRIAEHVDADLDMQQAAADALADVGPPAVSALIERLEAADEHNRARAAATLARIGPRASDAVAPLSNILYTDSDKVRRFAMIALGEIGPDARGAVDDLLLLLTDVDEPPQIRGTAATALGELGTVAEPAVDEMVRLIHDVEAPSNTRALCVLAVAKISHRAIPDLLQALHSDDPIVRIAAARALHSIDLTSKHALPALLDCVKNGDIGFLATSTMQEIGPDAVRYLLDTAGDEDGVPVDIRRAAVETLGDLFYGDELHQSAAPVLVDALRNEHLSEAAEYALSNLGPGSIPFILATLDEEELAGRGDSPFCESLRSLAVELCLPTGRGGAECLEEEMTGFARYDDLGMFNVPPAAAGARLMEAFPEEMAAPFVAEMAAPFVEEGAMPMAEESAEPEDETHAGSYDSSANENTGTPVDVGIEAGCETVKVFYGTNRRPEAETAAAGANTIQSFYPAAIAGLATMCFGLFGYLFSKARFRAAVACMGLVLTVTLAYGSWVSVSRTEQAASKPGPKYGTEHSDTVEMGVCHVSIPRRHVMGKLEAPSVLKFEIREDPNKHVILRRVERRDPDEFFAELRGDLDRRGDSIMIFVHGYNVTFEDAARRTAQMAYDLEFAGAPMFYSWPSQGSWYRYREDEKYVELAVDHIKQFLIDVAHRSDAQSIHLIAHSMGNRGLTQALKEMENEVGDRGASFNQVVLAAPDINADIFKHRIAPAVVERADRVTLYASSNDLALAASRVFNAGGPRAGDANEGPLVVPGIETIDVSNVDNGLLGHVYYGSNRAILNDLKQLLHECRRADERARLDAVAHGDQTYWVCRQPDTADGANAGANNRR